MQKAVVCIYSVFEYVFLSFITHNLNQISKLIDLQHDNTFYFIS